jgi:hypothetical protein
MEEVLQDHKRNQHFHEAVWHLLMIVFVLRFPFVRVFVVAVVTVVVMLAHWGRVCDRYLTLCLLEFVEE